MSKNFLALKKTMITRMLVSVFMILLLPVTAIAGPVIFYTDILSGPKTGGENNNGTYLSIFGKGFGTTRGTSTVAINGIEVAAYKCWNCSDQYGRPDVQKITVQPGGAVTSGPIVVTVNGQSSNSDKTFTVSSGDIYFVSHSGSDSSGQIGNINQPFRTLQTTYSRSDFGAGDQIVIRGDGTNWTDGGTNWLSTGKGGSSGSAITVIGYPGETIISNLRSEEAIALTSGANYLTLANFKIAGVLGGGGGGGNGSLCINSNDGQTGVRFVNLVCDDADATTLGRFHLSMVNWKALGVRWQNSGSTIDDNNAPSIYFCCSGNDNAEVGWSIIANQPTGRGFQIRSSGAGTPNTNIAIHDSILSNISQPAILIGDGGLGPINVYNNLIYSNGTKGGCLWVSASAASDAKVVNFYNNTCYDHTGEAILIEGGPTNREVNAWNNIFYQLSGSYLSGQSSGVFSNNLCYGVGSCPSGWSNSVNANPLFVDPTSPSRNFHIQAGSPVIDGGTSSILGSLLSLITRDADGTLRELQGNTLDIGAYEYCESGCAVTDTMPPSRPTGLLIQ